MAQDGYQNKPGESQPRRWTPLPNLLHVTRYPILRRSRKERGAEMKSCLGIHAYYPSFGHMLLLTKLCSAREFIHTRDGPEGKFSEL